MRLLQLSGPLGPALLGLAASSGLPYSEYILAPASRDVLPVSVHQVNGTVRNAAALTSKGSKSNTTATFRGVSSVTYDFGINIAGPISFDVESVSASDAVLSATFTESSLWINRDACDATNDAGLDSPLWFSVGKGGARRYAADKNHGRGAFRYMTLATNSTTASVAVSNLTVHYAAAPMQKDLRGYKGYFHSDDELINRIWYAGAYTTQLCTIEPSTGNALVWLGKISSDQTINLPQTDAWWHNYTISNGTSVLTDGAKRDRLLWAGDMSIAVESVAVSTGDLYSVRTALESLFAQQQADGRLPYAGKPFTDTVSFTYHLHTLIGVTYYYRHSGDRAWLARYWAPYQKGLKWALSSVDQSGLANITSSDDWLRFGMGGHNIEANAILYFVLNEATDLAHTLNDTSSIPKWTKTANGIKSAANARLWDSSGGLYRDNQTTTLHPQDGNVWAIKANLTSSTNQTSSISSALAARWGPYGAPAPEAGSTVSPFISGFELQAHYLSNRADRALQLLRKQWGFMLDDPRMTNSSFIEGYSTDGSLVYAPYTNDARVSHAHGWSAGPTAALTMYTAGLQLVGPAGKMWKFEPQLGGLKSVEAGFETSEGFFEARLRKGMKGWEEVVLNTPEGTGGEVHVAGAKGELEEKKGQRVKLQGGRASVHGGEWRLVQE